MPVMTMTLVVADFPIPDISVVSHLGCPARAKPELLVVSSVAMAAIECEVGILCTTRCVIGLSKWTLTGLDTGSRKKTTLQLSRVAFVAYILVRVTVSPFKGTICTLL